MESFLYIGLWCGLLWTRPGSLETSWTTQFWTILLYLRVPASCASDFSQAVVNVINNPSVYENKSKRLFYRKDRTGFLLLKQKRVLSTLSFFV